MAEIFRVSPAGVSADVFAGACLAIGVFDGFHVGHAALIGRLTGHSGRRGILTFDPDPDEVLFPGKTKKLMANGRRIARLAAADIDFVAVLPFDGALSRLEPDEFISCMFGGGAPAGIYVGEGFRFGCKARGDVDLLRAWGAGVGCTVESIPLVELDGDRVSATRIRALLSEGNISEANKLLGHNYCVEGLVERGRQEGADMGFATANVNIPVDLRALGEGVYAAYALVGDVRYKAAVSMGVSPTFDAAQASCEAHILDFEGDLYGKELRLKFVEYLRPMRKFDDVGQLIATVMGNIDWVRNNL